jgi:hypothetical protein
MSSDEIVANLHYFTQGLRGPRTVPCDELVLAGVQFAERPDLADALQQARLDGLRRVILHLGRGDRHTLAHSRVADHVDVLVVPVHDRQDAEDVASLASAGRAVDAVVVLDHAGLVSASDLTRDLLRSRPARIVYTWPLHGPPPPSLTQVLPAVRASWAAARAAGQRIAIRGMPTCLLGNFADDAGKARNRWYVDVDHQLAGALLFFPDVVRMARREVCRHCSRSDRCDGAPASWLETGLVPEFIPYQD